MLDSSFSFVVISYVYSYQLSRLLNTYTYTYTNQIRIRTIGNDLANGNLVRIGNPANLVRIGSPFAIVDDVQPSFARAKVASKATISEYSKTICARDAKRV